MIMKNKVYYGLTVDGENLMGFSVSSNGYAEFCNSTAVELEKTDDHYPTWLVKDLETAVHVSKTNEPWFNSGHSAPINEYVGECRVVKIETVDS